MFWRQHPWSAHAVKKRVGFLLVCALCIGVLWLFGSSIINIMQGEINIDSLLKSSYRIDPTSISSVAATKELFEKKVDTHTPEELLSFLVWSWDFSEGKIASLFGYYFPRQYALLEQIRQFTDDIPSLLGFKKPQSYLVLLQNSAEKRPNGWFFWSFVKITLDQWRISSFVPGDSYHPSFHNPEATIRGPEWMELFLPDREIAFVWANKIWFTYHDGAHIAMIYEKAYPGQDIRGVIFLSTDMFRLLIDGFTEQLWYRQYTNATVDLIKWAGVWWKKQYYLNSLDQFLQTNRKSLTKEFVYRMPEIIDLHLINIYLEDVSPALHTWLRQNKLTTRFEDAHAYFRDSNIVFNKTDSFVSKEIALFTQSGEQIGFWTGDIVSLPPMTEDKRYTFLVSYTLQVPEQYHDFIRWLNEEFGLVLWPREEHILGLSHVWATRWNVYFPQDIVVTSMQWSVSSKREFQTPFSNNAAYEMRIEGNGNTAQVRIDIEKKTN